MDEPLCISVHTYMCINASGSLQLNYWHGFLVCDLYLHLNMPDVNNISIIIVSGELKC